MSMLIISSIQLGLLYAIMAMGVYVTFRILNIPDMTTDGSFVLGMAASAVLTVSGHPYLALLAAIMVGGFAGLTTGLLQTKVKIHAILSGILVMTSLYTINLGIMDGKSNISLAGKSSIFTAMDGWLKNFIYQLRVFLQGGDQGVSEEAKESILKEIQGFIVRYSLGKTLIAVILCMALFAILTIFFKTKLGLAVRATGDNEEMVRSSSINADLMKCIGLALGNSCVALSGALISQYQMFSDVNSGSGIVVSGLASVIIGETIFGRRSVTVGILSVATGSIIYRIIIALALKYNIFPAYALKLVSSVIVAFALAIPTLMIKYRQAKQRRGA